MAIESTLIAAAIGGGCVLAGTIVSQAFGLLAGHIQRRHERDVRQRERLERISEAVEESLLWFHRIPNSKSIAEIQEQAPPPSVRRAAMLADLYFPELIDPCAAFVEALLAYHFLMLDSFQPDRQLSSGQQILLAIRASPEAKKTADDALELRLSLEEAIRKEAKKYRHT